MEIPLSSVQLSMQEQKARNRSLDDDIHSGTAIAPLLHAVTIAPFLSEGLAQAGEAAVRADAWAVAARNRWKVSRDFAGDVARDYAFARAGRAIDGPTGEWLAEAAGESIVESAETLFEMASEAAREREPSPAGALDTAVANLISPEEQQANHRTEEDNVRNGLAIARSVIVPFAADLLKRGAIIFASDFALDRAFDLLALAVPISIGPMIKEVAKPVAHVGFDRAVGLIRDSQLLGDATAITLSAAPSDGAFAKRLRRAIEAAGGQVLSPARFAGAPDAPAPAKFKQLQRTHAFVAVESAAALASPQLGRQAERYIDSARAVPRESKLLVVPVHLEPLPREATWPALRKYTPVTGPYGTNKLQGVLVSETLRRLGLQPQSRLGALIAVLLLLIPIAISVYSFLGPWAMSGGLSGLFSGSQSTPIVDATPRATIVPTATPTPSPTPLVFVSGGLNGQYFSSPALPSGDTTIPADVFATPVISRVDPQIDFHYGRGQYPDLKLASSAFAIRWTGQMRVRYSETYTIITHSDDGVRAWINDQPVIDDWTVHDYKEDRAAIALTPGQPYSIKIEYYEQGIPPAILTLQWQSPTQPLEIIPASQLYYLSPPTSG